ncbi:hypothetical protein HYH82_15325 [Clostridium botulinum]|uniref:hypothetical protein n=1 Tax=Clostridium botulinum TaxID=1491 RepID=UPI001C9B79F4|nr:hypothetical protein [Clostridium botulinum]MBY6758663.1 hypothetical protein [Clostridium botulinum]
MKFPEETEFVNEDIYVTKFKDGILQVKNKTKNSLDSWSKCLITREWLRAKFKLAKKDKKVSLEEAIKAFMEGKVIKVKHKNVVAIYEPEEFNGEYILTDGDTFIPEEILYGEWYIKEE